MSVNSVLPGLLPYYGPLSGNGSQQNAKAAPRAQEFPDQTSVNAEPSQTRSSAQSGESTAADQLQSSLKQALRQGGDTAGNTASTGSDVLSDSPSPGIATYQRISQYGNNEPSTSALLKRWNNIMQSSNGADSAAADFAKLLAQHETPGLTSGVLDLTA